MKIVIGMDFEAVGTVEVRDGEFVYTGNDQAIRPIVEFYAAKHTGALDELLEELPSLLRGRTWARISQ